MFISTDLLISFPYTWLNFSLLAEKLCAKELNPPLKLIAL